MRSSALSREAKAASFDSCCGSAIGSSSGNWQSGGSARGTGRSDVTAMSVNVRLDCLWPHSRLSKPCGRLVIGRGQAEQKMFRRERKRRRVANQPKGDGSQ